MKIAIIGGGIVGMTVAYYLSKTHDVTLFDDGRNQATSASAGIICPWLSQRRNKDWYRLTANGARFYKTLIADLQNDGIDTTFYRQNGAIYFKKSEALLNKLETLAHERRQNDAFIGDIKRLSANEIMERIPELQTEQDGLFISGGACIDGRSYLQTVKQAALQNGATFISERTTISSLRHFDKIVVCAGAYTKELLEALDYTVDITAQKGQLFTVQLENTHTHNYPVIIPQSEFDLLPFDSGHWVIGATHEKNMGFDHQVDLALLNDMKSSASVWMPSLKTVDIASTRVGTRAFTSDYLPCFGQVPSSHQLLVASGLGSSGLTNGPYIAYLLTLLINNQPLHEDISTFNPERYIQKNTP
ncbi:FAD-binding oxidoreductase [Carnobacteriaceae bacterium zg-ZUI252]|nr:FAD-binding oxidoreductase [Carnobacteriaceae bacterium zg-ZUI252]MBS4770060.1 FAD-binding oxidoreductase [Carnobacteriaceae bacterium zg-ZUI240]